MRSGTEHRTRVSRETRLLLSAALLALLALSVLARLRFRETGPDTPTPAIGPIFAPLVPRQGFADLAGQLSEVTARTNRGLASVRIMRTGDTAESATITTITALRLHSDVGVALLPRGARLASDATSPLIATDPLTGLTLVRLAPGSTLPVGPPLRSDDVAPRYLLTSTPLGDRAALLPTLVTGLTRVDAPLWRSQVLSTAAAIELASGAFVFTLDGEWVGLVAQRDQSPILVPAAVVGANADQLLSRQSSRVSIGIDIQPLTPALTRATQATAGVLVRWVDPQSPANSLLRIGDVLQAANHQALSTFEHWQRFLTDLSDIAPIVLSVRRGEQVLEIEVTPAASPPQAPSLPQAASPTPPQSLRLRLVRGVGSEILGIDVRSTPARAGLRVGDIITLVASTSAPTPDQVRRALLASTPDRPALVAVRRGSEHLMLAMEP